MRKEPKTTNWPARLVKRAELIADIKRAGCAGDTVFFCSPLCVGFGPVHAEHTLRAVWDAGALVFVYATGTIYAPGDDVSELYEAIEREANTAYVRAHRKRKSER